MSEIDLSIITPVFNGAKMIAPTIKSISEQSAVSEGRIRIEHIVIDGNSKDDTCRIVERTASSWTILVSEPDAGMYDALAKGLQRARGRRVCYLNAGDLLLPAAFDVVHQVFRDVPTRWITGTGVNLGPGGIITKVDPPYRYDRALVKLGAYGRILPFIQQEATVWERSLQGTVDFDRLRGFRLAGDHYLWSCFASTSELDVVHGCIGGFSIHPGQLSEDKTRYFSEMKEISGPIAFSTRMKCLMERPGWSASPSRRKLMNKESIRFDHNRSIWTKGNSTR